MVGQTEHEGQNTAQEREESSEHKKAENSNAPSNAELAHMLIRMKLKLIANYAMDGLVPAIAVIALIVAVMAINSNKSGLAQLGMSTAKIDSLSASLLASNRELEKLKATMAAEKSMQEQETKKQSEIMKKIIQNISTMQQKMKISPTLDEQFRQPASASAVTPAVASVSAPLATVPAPLAKAAASLATVTAPSGEGKKPANQGQVLKDAIEKFNQKAPK